MRTRLSALGIAAVALVAGVSCGGDDSSSGDASATTGGAAVTTAAPSPDTTAANGSAATSSPASETTGADKPAEDPDACTADHVGGELNYGALAFSGMSPYTAQGAFIDGPWLSAFYGTLMRYNAETDTYQPGLAESLTPNADFTEWTLKLRPDITFGSGDQMTSADVAAHVERMKTATIRAAGMANAIQSVQVVDDLTVVFDVGDPWGGFPYVLATELGWVPEAKIYQEKGEDAFQLDPTGAGAGAYEIVSVKPGEGIDLQRKTDYWGPQACIDTLHIKSIAGSQATYEAFSQGEFEAGFIRDDVVVAAARDAGDIGFEMPVGTASYITIDQGLVDPNSPFKDVRIREAMQLAVDYDAVNERIFGGAGNTTSALVPESSPYYSGVDGPPYDPDRAKELIDEVKAEGVWDGKFTLLVNSQPESQPMAVLFEAMWEAVGMDVTIEQQPNYEVVRRMDVEPNFQVANPKAMPIFPPAVWPYANVWQTDSPRGRTGYGTPEMDAALADIRAASTTEETKAALVEMQEVWNKDFPGIVWRHGVYAILLADNVHGVSYGADVTPYFDRAWVD